MGNQASRQGSNVSLRKGGGIVACSSNEGSSSLSLSLSSSSASTSCNKGCVEVVLDEQEEQQPLSFLPIDDDWPYVWAIRNWTVLDWRKACPTPDLLQQVALQQLQLPVEISSRLYLGDAKSIANIEHLQSLGITAVLNVATPKTLSACTLRGLEAAGIEYAHVTTKDEYNYPLLATHWDEIYTALQRLTTTGGRKSKVVVHCHAGQNRAGLVAAAYYMVTQQEDVLTTVRWLRRQRGNTVLVNHGFQEQLVALARKLNLLGSLPGTPGSIVAARAPPRTDPWIVPQRPNTTTTTTDGATSSNGLLLGNWVRKLSVRRKINAAG